MHELCEMTTRTRAFFRIKLSLIVTIYTKCTRIIFLLLLRGGIIFFVG